MIALKQMKRKDLMRKVKEPLRINKGDGMKADLLLRDANESYRRMQRKGMENYAKNPVIYNQYGINN